MSSRPGSPVSHRSSLRLPERRWSSDFPQSRPTGPICQGLAHRLPAGACLRCQCRLREAHVCEHPDAPAGGRASHNRCPNPISYANVGAYRDIDISADADTNPKPDCDGNGHGNTQPHAYKHADTDTRCGRS